MGKKHSYRQCSPLDLVGVFEKVHVSDGDSVLQHYHLSAGTTNLNIINEESRRAVGLAKPLPVLADTCL